MTEQEIWSKYKQLNPCAESYSAWRFGGGSDDISDELAELVKKGLKTATTSAYQAYMAEKQPLPSVDELNIILKTNGEAVCITKTTNVCVCRFCDVTSEHVYNEGEGDRSLEYWRKVHKDVFTKELGEYGLPFDEKMPVVCETFEIVM